MAARQNALIVIVSIIISIIVVIIVSIIIFISVITVNRCLSPS